MRITFCGDTHGAFSSLTTIAERECPDIIIQCGDFGIWPSSNGNYNKIKTKTNIPIYFCRGNHEEHNLLDTFPDFKISNLKTSERLVKENVVELSGLGFEYFEKLKNIPFPSADNIYLCESGSILSPAANFNILFIGGALSIDKEWRTPNKSWWTQETMWKYQVEYVLDLIESESLPKINVVVSHTCPYFMTDAVINKYTYEKALDPVCKLLDRVYAEIHPELWVFGHFHKYFTGVFEKTKFVALNMCDIETGRFNSEFFYNVDI